MNTSLHFLILSLLPTLVPLTNEVSNMVVNNAIDNENIYSKEAKIDDWNEKDIIVDFSIISTVGNNKIKTFDLEIQKKIKIDRKNKKKIKIMWRYNKGDHWSNYQNKTKSWTHKGFYIGEMINDFLQENQKIIFKNLTLGEKFVYDISQPDAMLAQLFIFTFKVTFTDLLINYTEPNWYTAITGFGFNLYLSEKYKEIIKKFKTKKERNELNLDFFNKEKEHEKEILDICFWFVMRRSTILEKYNPKEVWETNWI